MKGSWDSCGSTFHIHSGNGLRMGGNEIILSDGGGGGGGEDWQTRVFRKCLQKLLCVIGRAHRATFAVWFEKFSSSKMRCVPLEKNKNKTATPTQQNDCWRAHKNSQLSETAAIFGPLL